MSKLEFKSDKKSNENIIYLYKNKDFTKCFETVDKIMKECNNTNITLSVTGGSAVATTVTLSGNTATINPNADLDE